MAEGMEPAGRELAPAGRQRELSGEADALTALDERAALTFAAELQPLEPVEA